MALPPGKRLGPYEVTSALGAGGMGEVYRATDTRLGREVAIKVLRSEVASDPDRLGRFEREARAVAALNHPNIVTIHDIEETEGLRFLVMERIQGESLSQLIEPGGLPLKQILDWAIPIADALAAAHAHGVVHRDLKPGNVMISEEGRPKILDFGLARVSTPPSSIHTGSVTEALTAEGSIFGTVPYMAPEQLRGERADARTDLFAFGVILYEMASGRRPFAGVTQAEVAASILKEDPSPLDELRTDLPARFVKIVGHCLEKDPRQRIHSAADLRHDLAELSEELRTRPGSLAPAVPAKPIAARHWGRMATIAAAVLAAAIAVLVFRPFSPKRAAMPIQSLAVLPLKNYSGDASQDYFADGMTDALIANLAQIRALKVISRTSVVQYKDTKKAIPEIAKELGVEGIIEGSVVRSGSHVRVTAQLIDARQDRHLWASNYEREMTDVLSLQSDVVREIASQVRVQITAEERGRLSASRAVDPVVYDTTLKAVTLMEHATRTEEYRRVSGMFQSAVEKDPGYAPAWAGLAYADLMLYLYDTEVADPKALEPAAILAAEKALALAPDLAEAHEARASIAAWGSEWDFARARTHFERALELRPGYAFSHLDYANFLLQFTPEFEKARVHIDRARELDPFSPYNGAIRISYFVATGHAEQAVEEGRRLRQAEPGNRNIPYFTGHANLRLEKFPEAVRDFEAVLKLDPSRSPDDLAQLGLAYGRAGRREDARRILAELEQASRRRRVSRISRAAVHVGLGENDEAYRLLERAFEEREGSLAFDTLSPWGLAAYFKDPRWPALKARVLQAIRMPEGATPPLPPVTRVAHDAGS